ncbi:photoreceptor cilium actin regulator [Alosa sapidissima]|uniref:photoreceptor cilium actin regulator n=1 Tax=Alosa sapidissima TaxID=34773 RepID=UPI001C08A7D8|nr:photoreceptor cilium actin regulator [Alosa sapidissima]
MGCSPSKGNHFAGAHSPFRRGRTLLPANQENAGESDDGASGGSSTAGETDGERHSWTSGERQANGLQDVTIACPAKKPVNEGGSCSNKLEPQEIKVNVLSSQIKDKPGENQESGEKKAVKKTKKPIKGIKLGKKKEKDKKAPATETKVDFPELLVKAHQAAYGYLNPSITKYDVLLGLLDHAAQTQISLQPMVAFMLMRYEEINRGLEEIVEEGERLLKENGEHLAWPCQMKNLSTTSARTSASPSSPADPPPDLLQQLLQYTIQRMHLVSQSVSAVGDSALEEAVDYFTSVSDTLEEKLKVKRASEARLMRLLARVEAATLRKPGPEDSALFSEDSGIGAESESLAGSDRQRRRRESCESSGTNYTSASSPMGGNFTPVSKGTPTCKLTRKTSSNLSLNSIDSFCNFAKEQRDSEFLCSSASIDDDEREDGKDVDNHEGGECNSKKCPSASPLHACQQPRRLPSKRIENPQNIEMTLKMREAISGRIRFVPSSPKTSPKVKQTDSPKISRRQWNEEESMPKRPQTPTLRTPKKKTAVAKHRRTHSADSIRSKAEDPTLLELARTQKDLTQRLDQMSKAEGNLRNSAAKQGKGKTQPSSPSAPVRLRPLQKTPQSPSKSPKKTGHGNSSTKEREIQKDHGNSSTQGKEIKTEIQKESGDCLDRNTETEDKILPKPTPSSPTLQKPTGLYRGRNSVKRLIDTFSHGVEEIKDTPENVKILGTLKGVMKCGIPIIPGLGGTATVLTIGNDNFRVDSRASDRADDVDLDDLPPPPPEVLMDNSFENVQKSEPEEGGADKGHSPLLRRSIMSQKLRASMQSVTVLPSRGGMRPGSLSMLPPCPVQQEMSTTSAASHQESQQRDSNTCDAVPSTSISNSQSTATSTSKTRMLPSTPVTSCSLQRRLPSPHVFKRQPTPPSSASPPVTRKLPQTPPPVSQRRHPSPSAPSPVSMSTYPIKAPSPPASPKVQRWSRENSSDDSMSSSRIFSNARSVFCPASPSLFEAKPCPLPRPPQAWTSTREAAISSLWGDRGRHPVAVHGPKPFIRRSHSDRRPSLNYPPRGQAVSYAETCGSEPAIACQGLEDGPIKDSDRWDHHSDLGGATRSASHPDLCIIGQSLHRE